MRKPKFSNAIPLGGKGLSDLVTQEVPPLGCAPRLGSGRVSGHARGGEASGGTPARDLGGRHRAEPYTRDLGARLARYAPGELAVRLPVRAGFAQHHGFVHGSILGFMADTASAWAAASAAGDVVTSEYSSTCRRRPWARS